MDILLILLIIGGCFASVIKSAKAKARQGNGTRKAPIPQPKAKDIIPFTKAEWEDYLRRNGIPEKPEDDSPADSSEPLQDIPNLRATEVSMVGEVNVQGETEEEHAEHVHRVLSEESEIRSAHEFAQELRRINQTSLRQAVIAREILDPPVSLRE